MKKIVFSTVLIALTVLMSACSNDDSEDMTPVKENSRTVLVYMAGRNNLSFTIDDDIDELKKGSKGLDSHENLLVFVRKDDGSQQPWLARIKNGVLTDSVSLSDMGISSIDGENRASDPVVMEGVLRYAFNHYPATEGNYGLVLWGHSDGWFFHDEVIRAKKRAYGYDEGNVLGNSSVSWMNISTLAEVLSDLPHLKFIMADCCNFMCLEVLYDLRHVCDYIIGSPAEIPGGGAPYDLIVSDLFADGPFYTSIIDKYYQSLDGFLPLTAVKTSEMDHVAQATRQAMQATRASIGEGYADMTGVIHYYYSKLSIDFLREYCMCYDAGDFFLSHAPQDVYRQWKQVLDKAVVYRRIATEWETNKIWDFSFSDFTVTEEKMHGVSMFVEQDPTKGNYAKYNEDIKQTAWWKMVGL